MKAIFIALAAAVLMGAGSANASTIVARIDLSEQTMNVYVNGWPTYSWPVSTARRGYVTPVGSYRAQRLAAMWYSRKYDNSPMPHSIFFKGGYAIHGTGYVKNLGKPASHGCVRLHPDNAKTLFSLVKDNGIASMQVEIIQ
jgi:lipoprotein-anchoring transpeptidase ErfK/SrfK